MHIYHYTWYQWLSFFYIYCFAGWIFESTYVSIREKRPVNRGFLRLPLLPLYGTGAVMMLWVSLPFRDSLFLVYISGVIAATALEYVTGWTMERLFKMKYWDYSNQRFNVNGYICLSSSLVWGLLTIFLTEVLHPPVSDLVLALPVSLDIAGVILISILFAADTVQSVKDALDLGRALEAMTGIRAELDDVQVQLALLRAETADRLSEYRDDAAQKLNGYRAGTAQQLNKYREGTAQKIGEYREETAQKIGSYWENTAQLLSDCREEASLQVERLKTTALQKVGQAQASGADRMNALLSKGQDLLDRHHTLVGHLNRHRRDLLLRNPTAASKRFGEALKELSELAKKNR